MSKQRLRLRIRCLDPGCETVAGGSSPDAEANSVWQSFLKHWTSMRKKGRGHSGVPRGEAFGGSSQDLERPDGEVAA